MDAVAPAPEPRDRRIAQVLLVEGAANLTVLLTKLCVGLATGSVAILGDAVHSFADLANNGLAFWVARVAAAPPDREHPYGHRKFETLAVFALAMLLGVVALELAASAFRLRGEVVTRGWALALMLGVLAVNTALTLWQHHWAQRLDSDLLRADARHTLSDVMVTAAVIVGWQLGSRGFVWADRAATLGVSALILLLAWGLFQRAVPVLTDRSAADPDAIRSALRDVPGVQEVRRVRSKQTGHGPSMDVVVAVAPQLPTRESHAIADRVEARLLARFGSRDVAVHVEPADSSARGGTPHALQRPESGGDESS